MINLIVFHVVVVVVSIFSLHNNYMLACNNTYEYMPSLNMHSIGWKSLFTLKVRRKGKKDSKQSIWRRRRKKIMLIFISHDRFRTISTNSIILYQVIFFLQNTQSYHQLKFQFQISTVWLKTKSNLKWSSLIHFKNI